MGLIQFSYITKCISQLQNQSNIEIKGTKCLKKVFSVWVSECWMYDAFTFDKISPTMCDIFAKPQIAVCIFTRAVLFIFSQSQWAVSCKSKDSLTDKKHTQNVQIYKVEEHHIKLFEEPLDSRLVHSVEFLNKREEKSE